MQIDETSGCVHVVMEMVTWDNVDGGQKAERRESDDAWEVCLQKGEMKMEGCERWGSMAGGELC